MSFDPWFSLGFLLWDKTYSRRYFRILSLLSNFCYSFLILILLWFENTLWDLVLGNNSVLWLSILFILVIMYHTFAKKVYTTVYMYKVVCTSVRLRWWIVLFRYSVSLMFLSSLSTRWWKMHAEISLWLWYCSCLPLFLLSFDLYIFSFYY